MQAREVTPATRKPPANVGFRPICVIMNDVTRKAGISTAADRNAFQKMSPLSELVLREKP